MSNLPRQEQVDALVSRLRDTEKQLQELLEDQADACTNLEDRAVLLGLGQERLHNGHRIAVEEASVRQGILDALPAQVALVDKTGQILSVNQAWRDFAEANSGGRQGILSLCGPGNNYLSVCWNAQGENSQEAGAAAEGLLQVLQRRRDEFSLEYPCHSLRQQRWFRFEAAPFASGQVEGAVVMHVDITDRVQSEESLLHKNQMLQSAQRLAKLGGWHLNLKSGQLIWSREVYEIFGLRPEGGENSYEDFLNRILPEDRPEFQKAQECARQTGLMEVDYRIRRPDGEIRRLRQRGEVGYGQNGRVVSIASMVQDVTEQKLAEQKILQAVQLERTAGHIAHFGAWAVDLPPVKVTWSEEVCRIHDMPLGTSPTLEEGLSFYAPEWRETIAQAFKDCAQGGRPYDLELEIISAQGRRKWVRAIGRPLYNENGQLTCIQGAFQDITEKKNAQQEAARIGQQLTQTLETISEAFFTVDSQWRLTYLNRQFERLLNRDRQTLLGMNIWEAFPQAKATAFYPAYQKAVAENRPVAAEDFYPPADKWFEARAFPSESGLTVFFRDVTWEKEAKEICKIKNALLEKARSAIFILDFSGKIRTWNCGAEKVFGWPESEAVGANCPNLLQINSEDWERAISLISDEDDWEGELALTDKQGAPRIMEARWTVLRDEEGRPKAILNIAEDITEKRKLEKEFLQVQRLESVGRMASGIAHDLNNVLAPIQMSVDLLQEEFKDSADADLFQTIHSCAQRGANLVRQVLTFARGAKAEKIQLDLTLVIKELFKLLRETFPKNIKFRYSLPENPWTVMADPTHVDQILMNLCVNARDAMPEGGELSLRLENAFCDETFAATTPNAIPGHYGLIQVADTGAGMTSEVVEKVFDPFFSTKEAGRGTGLGLSTTLGLVRAQGGFIRVESQPGKGAVFSVYLPASQAEDFGAEKEPIQTPAPKGQGELILVVEDELDLSKILRRALESQSYRVLEASNGAEAVSVFAENKAEVDLVFTDLAMPIMDGAATIIALRKIDPGVKIVVASGFMSAGIQEKAAQNGVRHFVSKPYTLETIFKTLRQALDEKSAE